MNEASGGLGVKGNIDSGLHPPLSPPPTLSPLLVCPPFDQPRTTEKPTLAINEAIASKRERTIRGRKGTPNPLT